MAEQAEAEFNLRDLSDQELTEQVHDDLYNGLKAEVEEATHLFLERGWNAEKVLNDALVEGMRIVGVDFRDGILFVPEVLLAANSMKGGMEMAASSTSGTNRMPSRKSTPTMRMPSTSASFRTFSAFQPRSRKMCVASSTSALSPL